MAKVIFNAEHPKTKKKAICILKNGKLKFADGTKADPKIVTPTVVDKR